MHIWRALTTTAVALATLLPATVWAQEDDDQFLRDSAGGTLDFVTTEPFFTFDYSTPHPHERNWIGLFYSTGPGLFQTYGEPYSKMPVARQYAPGRNGTLTFPVAGLKHGSYQVFYFAKDGWHWRAIPIEVMHAPDKKRAEFMVDKITAPRARPGQKDYRVAVAGLVRDSDNKVTFYEGSNPYWVQPTRDGTLYVQEIPADAKTVKVLLWAKRGSSASQIEVTIPIIPEHDDVPLVDTLKVMSLNMWYGGSKVNDYLAKQVHFIVDSGVDLVGLQEDHQGKYGPKLAQALGWYSWTSKDSVSIISKYPIAWFTPSSEPRGGGVRVFLDDQKQMVEFWVAHLSPNPYGPYALCHESHTIMDAYRHERDSGRVNELATILRDMSFRLLPHVADEVPVLLVGDFNSPSHLDYVEGRREKNCGFAGVYWPTSGMAAEAGLIDSFRAAHPDPVKEPGDTYSPVMSWNNDVGQPEPQDRIDFIYHKGKKLTVVNSRAVVVGEPSENVWDNEWTSDHAAVLTTYKMSK